VQLAQVDAQSSHDFVVELVKVPSGHFSTHDPFGWRKKLAAQTVHLVAFSHEMHESEHDLHAPSTLSK